MKKRAVPLAVIVALSGCASSGSGGIAALRPSTGGTTGGQAVAANIVRAMGGGLIGGAVGADLSENDRRRALEAEYRALEYTPSGQPVIWRSSDPDRHGAVVAAAPYRVGSQDCRQYTHTVHIGGRSKEARGTACRNGDGSWTPLT